MKYRGVAGLKKVRVEVGNGKRVKVIRSQKEFEEDCEVLKCIASGGYGDVHLVNYKGLLVVRKIARDDTLQDLFIEEGLTLYHLQGVGGAPRLLGLSLKTPLILMSVCQGSQLDDIKPDLSLIDTSSWWLTIFTSVVNNIMELHSAGCIHNDIKSDNVIVNSNSKTSIIDYGIARMRNRPIMPFIVDNLPTVEEVDEYEDKYQRYAPELYFKGTSSAASDVYGLGKMFQDIYCEHKDTGLDTLWQEGLGNVVESMTCSKASQRLSLTQVYQELSHLCQPSQSETTHQQSSQSETTHQQSSQSKTTHQQSSQSETTHRQSSQSKTTNQQSSQSKTTHQRKVPLQPCRSLYKIVTAWAKRKNNKLKITLG